MREAARRASNAVRRRVAPGRVVRSAPTLDKIPEPDDEEVEEYLENLRQIPREQDRDASGKYAPAKVRRLSHEQQSFRTKLLQTSTPLAMAREHILERWTHAYLVMKLAFTAILAILLLVFGFLGAQAADENQVGQFAFKIMTTFGFLILFASLLGIYGAARVKRDLLKDDDGMGTPGQRMLEGFFHVSFAFNMVALPIAMAILTDRDAFLNDAAFGDTERFATAGACIILIASVVMILAMRRTIQIVTAYEMAHSFLESFSTLLVGLGVIGLLVAFSLLEFGQFLEDDSLNASVMTVLRVFMSLCAMLIVLSILGYGAALIEHTGMLKLHLASMAVLSVCVFAVTVAFAAADMEVTILSNCRGILQIMSEDWWQSTVSCEKYGGAAMGAQIEVYDADTGTYSYLTSGVGTSARCPALNQTAFAWEYYVAANASTTVLEGCLNEACCQVLANHILQHTAMIIYGSVALLVGCLVAMRADWWLICNTPPQRGTVKLISRKQARLLLSCIVVLIVAFIVAFATYFNNGSERVDPQSIADQLALQAFNSSDADTVASEDIHLCTNKIRDGHETDVDRGGTLATGGCQTRCAEGRACAATSDCITGRCDTTSLVCRRDTAWEQCNNGIRDGAETGVDCGGGTCRTLLLQMLESDDIDENDEAAQLTFLCALRDACTVDSDCASKYCDAGKCASCQDNRKNSDEGDVDCGSARCIEYYETYPEDSPSMFVTNDTTPAADEDGLCVDGRTCSEPSQCSSGICNEEFGICVSCSNGIQDGDETGVDCGGKVCRRRCPVGDGCSQQYDCRTQRCTSNCSDGFCGTGVCEPLFAEEDLLDESLAQLDSYTAILIDCTDGERSSHETDVDCGGSLCPSIGRTCDDGQSCTAHTDCDSSVCYGGVCVSCENSELDGQETDVDCGGAVCARRCAKDQGCAQDDDCRVGLFCWTEESLQFTIEALTEQNLTDLIDELETPELNTCQRVSNLTSDTMERSILSSNLTLGDIFVPPYMDAGPEQSAALANRTDADEEISDEESQNVSANASVSTRRRLQRNLLSRRSLWSFSSKSSKSSSSTSLYSFWPYVCPVVSTYTSESDTRFEVESLNSAEVELVSDAKAVVTRKFGSGTPVINIYASSCAMALTDGVTVSRSDSVHRLCRWLDLPSISFASLEISSTTILQGSVVDASGNPIENAYVRMWSARKGSCADTEGRSSSCDEAACNVYDSVYSSCANDNADCCTWTEDEDLLVTSCTDGDASTTPLVDSTSSEGAYYVAIPMLEAAAGSGTSFRITYTVSHDEYVTSQGNIVTISLGSSVSLPDIQLTPRALAACACESFEAGAAEDDSKLCKNPVSGSCAAPGDSGSCASYSDREACDNTITVPPSAAPTAKPTTTALTKGNLVDAGLVLGSNYMLEFRIQLHEVHSDWRNVLIRGSYWEERAPAVWIYPDSPRLHIRFSTSYSFNEGCDPANLLEYDQEYLVRVEVFLDTVKVYIDDELSCSRELWGTLSYADTPLPVYVSSQQYEPASCTLGSLEWSNITDRPVPSPTPAIPRLTPGTVVDTISLSRNWQFDFRMTVYDTTASWANVIHFGSDRWDNRIWILWLVPGTTRLSVRVNTVATQDTGCQTAQALTLGQTYSLHIEVFEAVLEVHVDGKLACSTDLYDDNFASNDETLYMSGPWYTGAPVEVTDMSWSDITDRPTSPPTTIPQLTQGAWSETVALEASWFLEFRVALFEKASPWTSVLHLGNENYNRGPGIWFYPGSSRLHVRTSLIDSRNAGCDPPEYLELGREYHVRLEFVGYTLVVLYDGENVCEQTFLSPFHVRGEQRLYISDPWYTPAKATVTDVAYGALTSTATPAPTVALLPTGEKLFDVTLGPSWQLDFDLVVFKKRTVIAELLHVGTQPQQRVPLVALMPYSSALQIRISTTDFWNDGCNTKRELELGQTYAIQVQLYAQEYFVLVDGVLGCRVSLSAPMVQYGSLPVWSTSTWATPAYAEVSNVVLENSPCDVCSEAVIRARCDNRMRFRQYELVDGALALTTSEHSDGEYDETDWQRTWTKTISITKNTHLEFECKDVGVVGGFAATIDACGEVFVTDETLDFGTGNRPFEFFLIADKTDDSDTSLSHTPMGQGRWGTRTSGDDPLLDSSVAWVWNKEIWNTMTFGFNVGCQMPLTAAPTLAPTDPTPEPTRSPTPKPTASPTPKPTTFPTKAPSERPTDMPTLSPTKTPTQKPTVSPTSSPTPPTHAPTNYPSRLPTDAPTPPTETPTNFPTDVPTAFPTPPTKSPTNSPTDIPTAFPTPPTSRPTSSPTDAPTAFPTPPTSRPTSSPTDSPTASPTPPTSRPTSSPTDIPTAYPTPPTNRPTSSPTDAPTASPTPPTNRPTNFPSAHPTKAPTPPTSAPTDSPTAHPTMSPSRSPTASPSDSPTRFPTRSPTMFPTPACGGTNPRLFVVADFNEGVDPRGSLHSSSEVGTTPVLHANASAGTNFVDLPSASSSGEFSEFALALDTMEVLDLGRYDWFLLKVWTECRPEVDDDNSGLCRTQASAAMQVVLNDTAHGEFVLFDGSGPEASGEIAVALGELNPVLVANVDRVTIRVYHTTGTRTRLVLDQASLWGCTTERPTQHPTLAPTFAPVDWTTEPFTEIIIHIVSIEWISTMILFIEERVAAASQIATGWEDFAFVNQITAEWTETFDLEVDDIGACAFNQQVMEETMALARCGPVMSSANSSCSATLSVSGNIISVQLDLHIGTMSDAHALDMRQTAPTYDTVSSLFLQTLQSSVQGCWGAYSRIEGPDDLVVEGTLTIEVSVKDHVNTGDESTSAQDVNKELEDLLGGDALESDTDLMKDFPNAVNISVDPCPAARLCSGNGVCCNKASQYTIDCSEEEFGKCICNDGWTGFDCGVYNAALTPTVAPTDAKCIPRESFGGEGASEAMLALCAAEGACQSNPLMCEYWKSVDYATAGITACEDGEWFEVFHQFDCRVTFNLGRTIINSLFELRRMWRYDIGAETYLYYEYTSETLPSDYSAYDMMLNEWSSLDGSHLVGANFSLFASEVDMVNGTNAWQWSNYDDAVGFPRDARPIALQSDFESSNQTWAEYVTSYYNKWAKAHCTVSQHKTPVKEFSFSLCIPESESTFASEVSTSSLSTGEASSETVDTFTVSGDIRDMQTGGGVEARVRLFRGRVTAWDGVTPLENEAATFVTTSASSEVDAEGSAGFTTCISALDEDADEASTEGVYLQSSTFSFDALAAGTYTVVVSYEAGLVGETVLESGAFAARADTFEVSDADVNLSFEIAPSLAANTMLVVFETEMLGLDAVIEFSSVSSEEDSSATESCVVSAKLLADGACSCGSAHLVRADTVLQASGKAMTVIYLAELYQTQYKVYLSRTNPVASTAYKKHRDDGRCGPSYPLANGEAAQCPPVEVTWSDGTTGLRPCCHILSGECGSGSSYCETRWSIDYRMFLDDTWMSEYREDLYCNRPDMLYSSEGADIILAKCPVDAPCCSPQAKCGSLAYHCDSMRSIDYRSFYEAVNGSASGTLEPVEESGAVVYVYTSSGLAQTFQLPDPLEQLNYFDGHEYISGEASASSTFMRAFCIDASLSAPQLHEYPSPRYFEWKGQMKSMSTACPGTSECTFARMTGLLSSFERADGVQVPALSGIYLRRYATQGGFKAYLSSTLSQSAECRAAVEDPSDGKQRWYIRLDAWDPQYCMDLCEDDDDCQAVAALTYIEGNSQTNRFRCTFHKNIHLCSGVTAVSVSSSRTAVVYRQRASLASSGVWYSQLSTMFNDADDQVHLYRDESTNTWYLDNDLVPGNGHYALAVSSTDSETPPTTPWRYVSSFSDQTTSAHTGTVSVLAYEEDCLVGENFPTLNSTAEASGCSCSGEVSYNCYNFSCSAMRFRIKGTDICLEADAASASLLSNQCEVGEPGQAFIYNIALKHLEVRATNASDGAEAHFVIAEDFALTKVTSAATAVSDALEFDLTEDGYICLATAAREYTSYEDAEQESEEQTCIFLASAPGDVPLLVDYDRRTEWSEFTVA